MGCPIGKWHQGLKAIGGLIFTHTQSGGDSRQTSGSKPFVFTGISGAPSSSALDKMNAMDIETNSQWNPSRPQKTPIGHLCPWATVKIACSPKKSCTGTEQLATSSCHVVPDTLSGGNPMDFRAGTDCTSLCLRKEASSTCAAELDGGRDTERR